jgi:hypothetical protein
MLRSGALAGFAIGPACQPPSKDRLQSDLIPIPIPIPIRRFVDRHRLAKHRHPLPASGGERAGVRGICSRAAAAQLFARLIDEEVVVSFWTRMSGAV